MFCDNIRIHLHYLESKVAFFKTEDFYMEQNGGFQAPEDGEDDDVFRIHLHPKHLILAEECLQTSNCRSLGLCQQKERQLQGHLVKDLQSYKRENESSG